MEHFDGKKLTCASEISGVCENRGLGQKNYPAGCPKG